MYDDDITLTHRDYLDILNYYKYDSINMNVLAIKTKAEQLISEKLCRCIQKVAKSSAPKKKTTLLNPYAICINNVVNKKRLHIYNFKCRNNTQTRRNQTRRKPKPMKLYKTATKLNLKKPRN